jgi:hypothetical protein
VVGIVRDSPVGAWIVISEAELFLTTPLKLLPSLSITVACWVEDGAEGFPHPQMARMPKQVIPTSVQRIFFLLRRAYLDQEPHSEEPTSVLALAGKVCATPGSVITKRFDRVNPRGPAGRDVSRGDCRQGDQERARAECRRIEDPQKEQFRTKQA